MEITDGDISFWDIYNPNRPVHRDYWYDEFWEELEELFLGSPTLTYRGYWVLRYYYLEKKTITKIAIKLNCSRVYVNYLKNVSIEKLRRKAKYMNFFQRYAEKICR